MTVMTVEPDEARWQAVLAHDAAADGTFCYAVSTTGVYCRPSCPARRPLRRNVRFFANGTTAEAAGFKPCKRCRPDAPSLAAQHAGAVEAACRRIEEAETPPTLAELAALTGFAPRHFHRLFKAATGATPRAYAASHKRRAVAEALSAGQRVTDAIYEAGYGSSSRFYEKAARSLGMAPRQYRDGGRGTAIRYTLAPSSLGTLLVAATQKGICSMMMGDDEAALIGDLEKRFPHAGRARDDAFLGSWLKAAVALIDAPGRPSALPLDIRGTAFQEQVWQALSTIPPGETRTYSEIAQEIGRPTAVRAVAAACAANPVAVAIPCHRAVRRDGTLAGYRWGVKRKAALLQREKER
jgi:AraC family transcriptional regulator of adaptative response/methylated-DNA-[protein]-cysteine methyltransferase